MSVVGTIADSARGEIPETWQALEQLSYYGDPQLEKRVNLVMVRLFGRVLDEVEQEALDPQVIDYAGKAVVLKVINAGIDYWSKQATQIGATRTNEQKQYQDRAKYLTELRAFITTEMALEWPEIVGLLPIDSRVPAADIPQVRDVDFTVAYTPDPDLFEPAFGVPDATTQRNLGGGGSSSGG